jgi:hypothetical protein
MELFWLVVSSPSLATNKISHFFNFCERQGPKRPGGVKDFIQLDPALEKRVDDALRRRNYLAHDFWRERGMEMISVKRRNIVCADLEADRQFFEELAKDLEAVAFYEVRTIGLDADKLKSKIDESVKQVQRELAR